MNEAVTPSPHDLAQSLTDDLNQVSGHRQEDELNELNAFIDSVPERIELTNTRRFLYGGPLMAIAPAMLTVGALMMPGGNWKGALAMFGLTVFGLLLGYLHRNAGKQVHMVLTRTHFEVFNLSAPVAWRDVTKVVVRDDMQMQVLFDIDPDATLPKGKRVIGIFPSQGLVMYRRKPPKILIWSAGVRIFNGPKLDADEVLELIDSYLQVAEAIEYRDALLAQAGD